MSTSERLQFRDLAIVMRLTFCSLVSAFCLLWWSSSAHSAEGFAPFTRKASPRTVGEGPYRRLVLENGLLISGTSAPARGPVSIVIEGNRIVEMRDSGAERKREQGSDSGARVIDLKGAYVLPGFIDTHIRVIDDDVDLPPDYALKLLLAHGVTTCTSMQGLQFADWALALQRESATNHIVAPRIQVWVDFNASTPSEGQAKVRQAHAKGVNGVGEGDIGGPPEVSRAVLAEARKLGMGAAWHMDPLEAQRFNALDAARAGMQAMSHWYGLPEALFDGRSLQNYPAAYNFNDVHDRFRQAGRLWAQAATPGSERWNAVRDELIQRDFTLEPTFSVYEANRDYMGVSRAEWLEEYLHPLLRADFTPKAQGRFSHFYDWTSTDEVQWKHNYQRWMQFVNDYKNHGGRVVAGSDSGYMWTIAGFGFVRNLELLEEAGFTPLEVLSAATLKGAELLGMAKEVGSVELGKLADLVIVEPNPLENLKVLYGTGVLTKNPDGSTRRIGGVHYTIKDGIVYDARALLTDVKRIVTEAQQAQ